MKKLLLFTAIAIFSFGLTFAQEVRLGAKAGVNFAKLTGDSVEDADGRTGFHIGAVVEIPVSDKFSVQPEVVYSQQGLQMEDEFAGETFESKLILDYINIPIMGKYYVADGFSLEFGPSIGINAKAESEVTFDGETETEDVKDFISGTDISIGGGVGYRLTQGIFFQARYMFGVSDVADDDEVFGDSLTNSVLSLSVGYSF